MSWAAAAMMLSSASPSRSRAVATRTSTRWPPRRGSSDSARPICGTRTVASASATTSSGRPWASLPNTNATGPDRSDRYRSSAPSVAMASTRNPAVLRRRRSLSAVSAPRTTGTMEQRPRRRAHRLGVVDVDRASGEHHPAGTRRVGRAKHGARVPGVAHLVQDHEAPVDLGAGVETLDRGSGRPPPRLRGHGGGDRLIASSPTSWTSTPCCAACTASGVELVER